MTVADIREIDLGFAGTVTLTVDVNLFELAEPDRAFIDEMLRLVREYESRKALQSAGTNPAHGPARGGDCAGPATRSDTP